MECIVFIQQINTIHSFVNLSFFEDFFERNEDGVFLSAVKA